MNMLLHAPKDGVQFKEIEIKTVYIDNNSGSHFHPIRDALLVFSRVIAYAASSMLSFIVDYVAYAILIEFFNQQPQYAFIGARAISSVVNFCINRSVVFGAQKGKLWAQALGYYALVVVIAVLGSVGVEWGTSGPVHLNEYIVKIIVDKSSAAAILSLNVDAESMMVFKNSCKRVLSDLLRISIGQYQLFQ